MRWALCVMVGATLTLTIASAATSTPRSYWYLDERISRIKNYTEEVKANAVSSAYLMGQGNKDWEKERLIILEPFERAAWVSQNLKKFFQSDGPEEAEALKRYRLMALTALLDLANFTSLVAKNFIRPIGLNRDCGLYPENVLQDAVAQPLESTLEDLTNALEEMRRNVTDGSYKAEEQGVDALKSVCKTVDINVKMLEELVGPGCENARDELQKELLKAANETIMEGGNENG
ncbi:hypothetical protein AAVH_34965 [Aphelenchoides avenae]|nr:hypothetical protein AAVH_34965 [Aphelenchus avenae]